MAKDRNEPIYKEEEEVEEHKENSSKRDRHKKSKRKKREESSSSDSGSEESSTGSEDARPRSSKKRRRRRRSSRRSSSSESDSDTESESDAGGSEEGEEGEEKKRRERRRRRREKEERRRRREKRRRKEKEEKEERRRKKEKNSRKKKKEKDGGKKGAVTNSWGKYGTIRETDMWNKRPEFTAWLAEVKQVNLETLPNWEEKQMFKAFMEDHNTATFPSKKYYNLDAYHHRKLEKELKKGLKKVSNTERTIFNDEEQRRIELQRERERYKEEQVEALKCSMQSGMAQAMKDQARLKEEMAYQYRLGNFEAAAAIQRRLDPDVAM